MANKKRREIINKSEISELRTYRLGGYPQKVLFDGMKKTNPLLLFLHGGPGAPVPFCEGCRGMFPEITSQFTLVCWDQFGCGINNQPVGEDFTVEHFAVMAVDLVKQIREEFPDNPLNLFAVSWGSVLAVKLADRIPGYINRVICYGQVLRQLTFNEEVFQALEKSKMPERQKQVLRGIRLSEAHSIKELKTVMGWTRKYTEGYQSKKGGKTPLWEIICGILGSPDYTLKDFKAVAVNGYLKNKSLLNELIKIDLSEELRHMSVPYFILNGDTDIVTPTKLISDFVGSAKNDNLRFSVVKYSGHMPGAKGMDEIIRKGFAFLRQ